MPAAAKLFSATAGHGCWPPTTVKATSPNVVINNAPAAILGDKIIPHCCPLPKVPCKCHSGPCFGWCTVLNGLKPLQKVGDTILCCPSTDRIATGSPNVLIGG